MMTRVDYPDASGVNGIEWDFVEVGGRQVKNDHSLTRTLS